MTSLLNGDLVTRASHIKIYEIFTTSGDLVVSVNDSNYTQAWLSAEDTSIFLAAHDAFNANATL